MEQNPNYYKDLAEKLKNTDGMIAIKSQKISAFLECFHADNPFMKIEAIPKDGHPGIYNLIVISGG